MKIQKISQITPVNQQPVQQQPVQPQQQSPYQLTPEENRIFSSIRQKLLMSAPEIGDIMQNQRSRAIMFSVLEALGDLSTGQIKTIIDKVQKASQQPDQGVVQQETQTMVPPSG